MAKINAILFVVSDLDSALSFFCHVLDCQEIERSMQSGNLFQNLYKLDDQKNEMVRLSLGKECIYLLHLSSPSIKPYPLDVCGNDLSFQHIALVVSNMEKAYQRLMQHKIKGISPSPQTIPEWNKAAAGIQAFYFRSPIHYPLELIYFPSGKGNPRWQQEINTLFLGIDHTAITVADTKTSLKFYRDLLGFQVVGGSLNYGETQEKLSGVSGAKVEITALHSRQGQGIGLEFLHYLFPKNAHSTLSPVSPSGQARMHLMVEVEHFSDLEKKLREANISILSEGELYIDNRARRSLIINDPDGHRLIIY